MLGEALRLLRVYHDLSQSELAARLKKSKSHLSEIESGTKLPSLELIDLYANEFDIPASAILFFAENLEAPSRTRADRIVAKKILTLLRFIEQRSEKKDEKKRRRLSN